MADDAQEERFERFEDMVRRLTAMLMEQRTFNQHIAGLLQEQRDFNRQQVEINTDVKTTLARIETLIARMIPTSENGRDA
jgi:hypothetical protein